MDIAIAVFLTAVLGSGPLLGGVLIPRAAGQPYPWGKPHRENGGQE